MIQVGCTDGDYGWFVAYMCNLACDRNNTPTTIPLNKKGVLRKFENLGSIFVPRLHTNKLISNKSFQIVQDINAVQLPHLLNVIHVYLMTDPADIHIDTYDKFVQTAYEQTIHSLNKVYAMNLSSGDSCPRYVLREFFKFGFKDPYQFGFNSSMISAAQNSDELEFDYMSVLSLDAFANEVLKVANEFNLPCQIDDVFNAAYNSYIETHPYFNATYECQRILDAVLAGEDLEIPESFTVFHQAYINAKVELNSNNQVEMPFYDENWFETTKEISEYVSDQLTKLQRLSIIKR